MFNIRSISYHPSARHPNSRRHSSHATRRCHVITVRPSCLILISYHLVPATFQPHLSPCQVTDAGRPRDSVADGTVTRPVCQTGEENALCFMLWSISMCQIRGSQMPVNCLETPWKQVPRLEEMLRGDMRGMRRRFVLKQGVGVLLLPPNVFRPPLVHQKLISIELFQVFVLAWDHGSLICARGLVYFAFFTKLVDHTLSLQRLYHCL